MDMVTIRIFMGGWLLFIKNLRFYSGLSWACGC